MISELEKPQNVAAVPAAIETPDPRRWLALFILFLGGFMDLLDTSIVNVAIPPIQHDLNASYSAIQWITAGYTLTYALVLITAGRLGDIFGPKRMFLIGVAGFTLASLLAGMSQTTEMLIVARVIQGSMAAVMTPQVLSLMQISFPPQELIKTFGMYGAIIGLATVSGPLLGGVLTQANLFGLGWRPIFLVNLPIGIFTFVAAARIVREVKPKHALRLDLPGVALVTVTLLLLLYPLVQGREMGWPTWSFVAMAAALPMFIIFVLYERRKTRADGSPLVVLELFRQRAFVLGMLINLVFFTGVGAFFLVFILYLQIGLGFTPLQAGLIGLPFSLGASVGSIAGAQLGPKLGKRIIGSGALLMALGMGGMMLTIQIAGNEVNGWNLLPSMLLDGIGMGLLIAPLADIILQGVYGPHAGSASGIFSTINQLGSAVGVAIIGVIFFGLLASQADASVASVTPQIRSGLQAAGVPAPIQSQVVSGFQTCFHDKMSGSDPFATPPSCQLAQQGGATNPQIAQVMGDAATNALKRNFSEATKLTLWYEVGVFLLTFLLILLLPKARSRSNGEWQAQQLSVSSSSGISAMMPRYYKRERYGQSSKRHSLVSSSQAASRLMARPRAASGRLICL